MKTESVYSYDSYKKEIKATVLEMTDEGVIFDKTIFYPGGGGQIHDTGCVVKDSRCIDVIRVFKKEDEIFHVLKENVFKPGDDVTLKLDWNRRYKIMCMHTSLHIIGAIMYRDYNVLITGSNIEPERARIDFPMNTMNSEIARAIVGKADSIAKEGHDVKVYFMPVDEALKKKKDLFRVADFSKYEKYLKETVRIVEIVGVDIELDGGTHVKNTSEIKSIKFLKYESKGRNNRRIYISVET